MQANDNLPYFDALNKSWQCNLRGHVSRMESIFIFHSKPHTGLPTPNVTADDELLAINSP
jgi:hypothetical protein